MQEAIAASLVDYDEILRRNEDVVGTLAQRGLTTVDVSGDGTCSFRAASLILTVSEDTHALLRGQVAAYIELNGCILNGVTDISPDDGESFSKHVSNLRIIDCPVGGDAVLALACVYHRDVIIHIPYAEPRRYSLPDGHVFGVPISLAFLYPGHYRAVVLMANNIQDHTHLNGQPLRKWQPVKENLSSNTVIVDQLSTNGTKSQLSSLS